jgi:hypothetical protein
MAPGPLTSPLSAGLSVVVADSLRGLPRDAGVGERDISAQSEERKGSSTKKRGRSSGRRGSKGVSRSRRESEIMGADGRSYDGAAAGLGALGAGAFGGAGGTRRSSKAVFDEEEDVIDEAEEAGQSASMTRTSTHGKGEDSGGG